MHAMQYELRGIFFRSPHGSQYDVFQNEPAPPSRQQRETIAPLAFPDNITPRTGIIVRRTPMTGVLQPLH
jgi:hypothetical protein